MGRTHFRPWLNRGVLAVSLLALGACGGGDGKSGGSASLFGFGPSDNIPALPTTTHPTTQEAGRFLTQATFGPTDDSITSLTGSTYDDWITAQFASPETLHLADIDARYQYKHAKDPNAYINENDFYDGFWQQAVTGDDQLRQRVALALSEIFVTSFTNPNVDARGMADYYDVLSRDAFGNFRDLLQDVTLHPMMGIYLNALGNEKEDPTTGRHPDENYAREVMQLMTIGLYQLNTDGTKKLDLLGQPIPSYEQADVKGLAKVLTGWSWYSPSPDDGTFYGWPRDNDASVHAMIAYNDFHSTAEKDFLGTTIPASNVPDAKADLKVALDTLFNHPNVGPFISKQLIQRLVTSNPSPDYVRRVATVFNNNGSGVRGDMKAVVRAILTDTEARGSAGLTSPTFGKLREPVVRMAHVLRAFKATSHTGQWLMDSTSDSLKQSPLDAGSVFNFWRPGYVPPNTTLGDNGYVAPEFQGVNEISVSSYVNTMQYALSNGLGEWFNAYYGQDIQFGLADEANKHAGDPAYLADHMNLVFLNGQMSAGLRAHIITAVSAIDIVNGSPNDNAQNRLNRVRTAILLTVASPEYIAQR